MTQQKTAIRFRGFRPSRKTLTDRAIDRDFKPPAFLRTPSKADAGAAAGLGLAAGGAGTLGYAGYQDLFDRPTEEPFQEMNELERLRQREQSLYESAGEGFGGMQESSQQLIEGMTPILEQIQQMQAQGASDEEVREMLRALLTPQGQQKLNAGTDTHHAIVRRLRRRRGDDKYNNVNYDTNPGKPDATHDGSDGHEKDAHDVLAAAASSAFTTAQRAKGRKLAEQFLRHVA